jgi:hypothetical protein
MKYFTAISLFLLSTAGYSDANEVQQRQVIVEQINALQDGDIQLAYSFASQDIQRQFGSARRFYQVIFWNYPALIRTKRFNFTESGLIESNQAPYHVMELFVDSDLWRANYLMKQEDDSWKIDGVLIQKVDEETAI